MTRRARTGERGAAVVDFVLVLLVLLPLVLGILQLALVLHVRNTLASAAAEGARHAAVAGSSAPAGQAKVQDLVDGALSQEFVRSVSVRPALGRRRAGLRGGRRGRGHRARPRRHRDPRPRRRATPSPSRPWSRREAPRRDGLGARSSSAGSRSSCIVPLIWIVISVFEVQQGAFATSAAARAAGRAYALAPDDATGEARAPGGRRAGRSPTRAPPASEPGSRSPARLPATTATSARRSSRSASTPASTCRSSRPSSARARRPSRSTRRTRCRSGSTSRARRRTTSEAPSGDDDEQGQVTLLIIGFAGILLMAIVVVIDASAAYLQRQGLDNLADGAALYGADLGSAGDLRAGSRRRAADPAGGGGRGGRPRLPRPGRRRRRGSPGIDVGRARRPDRPLGHGPAGGSARPAAHDPRLAAQPDRRRQQHRRRDGGGR